MYYLQYVYTWIGKHTWLQARRKQVRGSRQDSADLLAKHVPVDVIQNADSWHVVNVYLFTCDFNDKCWKKIGKIYPHLIFIVGLQNAGPQTAGPRARDLGFYDRRRCLCLPCLPLPPVLRGL